MPLLQLNRDDLIQPLLEEIQHLLEEWICRLSTQEPTHELVKSLLVKHLTLTLIKESTADTEDRPDPFISL